MTCWLAFWEDCSGGKLVRGEVWYSRRQSVLNGKEWRLAMLLKCRSKLWGIQSFFFQRMLQSVFLMMEGSDGGITISGLRLMISVRLPLFDSEPGTRRNRTWDETQPNLGRDTTESGTAFAGKFGWWIVGPSAVLLRWLEMRLVSCCFLKVMADWRYFASWNSVENRKIQECQKINSILFGVIGKIL